MATQKVVIYNAVDNSYDVVWIDESKNGAPDAVTRKVGGYSGRETAEGHRTSGS